MIYKTIDLCAGIGGIRRGFEMTGRFENVLSAEIDPYAAMTYTHLFGDDPTNDLTSEEFKTEVVNTDYDVLLAGFPCQAFSRVGKQQGFRDTTRGTIFFDIADIISRTNPRAIFLENVENLVSHDHGNTIETIIKTLEEELEYRVIGVTMDEDGNYVYSRATLVRNTKEFGLPQNRPRAYIMAFSKRIYGNAVKLLNKQLPLKRDEVIFRDVTELLDTNVEDKYYMAQGYLDTLKRHKARQQQNGYGFGRRFRCRDFQGVQADSLCPGCGGVQFPYCGFFQQPTEWRYRQWRNRYRGRHFREQRTCGGYRCLDEGVFGRCSLLEFSGRTCPGGDSGTRGFGHGPF